MRINDRGPFTRGRVIDLTRDEANQLGFTNLAPVVLTVIPVLIDPGLPVRLRCCKGRARDYTIAHRCGQELCGSAHPQRGPWRLVVAYARARRATDRCAD